MIEHIIESTLCMAVFYVIYTVFLQGSINHRANRIVLLFAPIFSVLVPLLHISIDTISLDETGKRKQVLEALPVSNYIPSGDGMVISRFKGDLFDIWSLLFMVYIAVLLVLVLRFALHLKTLFFKWRTSEKANYKGHILSLIDEKVPPFTFFQSIFMNREEYKSGKFSKELIVHEIAHKYQYHSIDIVVMELLQAVFWFNPFIYLFKRKIKTNHEYLADDFVLQCGTDAKVYANQLLDYTFPHKIAGFASAFNNHFTIKNRLNMLSRFQEKRSKAYRFLLLIPITSLLFVSTAFNETALLDNIPTVQTQEDKRLEGPGAIYADNLTWSSADNKIYLKGGNVRVIHGDNNFTVNGRSSYLGKVDYFVFNNELAPKDIPIDIYGVKCTVVKLSSRKAVEKYGSRAVSGAVVITTSRP